MRVIDKIAEALRRLALEGAGPEAKISGLLSLVDLAGSERVQASGVTGERLREAPCIVSYRIV